MCIEDLGILLAVLCKTTEVFKSKYEILQILQRVPIRIETVPSKIKLRAMLHRFLCWLGKLLRQSTGQI